uniref:ATP synthase complex subunit 8 n=1 Tax=Devario interruptus TaxID=2883597 RepID=A0A976LZF0_9TELE|nr:ATP synthase F0 subunit 8 [Devario shanensis]YP_010488801.1 ATP synthase F0 subunit 8 [Devario interruptus]UDN38783.1 ATP synthase F0 subunit 8 [Devario interruptus]UOG84836.1 ATP synthase F0 subunit 8 [Devario shanensis]
MPQLNPNPWFAILVFSWIIFLTIIPTKIMNHIQPNDPTLISSKEYKNNSWTWPW